jgi:hypothetical protein
MLSACQVLLAYFPAMSQPPKQVSFSALDNPLFDDSRSGRDDLRRSGGAVDQGSRDAAPRSSQGQSSYGAAGRYSADVDSINLQSMGGAERGAASGMDEAEVLEDNIAQVSCACMCE